MENMSRKISVLLLSLSIYNELLQEFHKTLKCGSHAEMKKKVHRGLCPRDSQRKRIGLHILRSVDIHFLKNSLSTYSEGFINSISIIFTLNV